MRSLQFSSERFIPDNGSINMVCVTTSVKVIQHTARVLGSDQGRHRNKKKGKDTLGFETYVLDFGRIGLDTRAAFLSRAYHYHLVAMEERHVVLHQYCWFVLPAPISFFQGCMYVCNLDLSTWESRAFPSNTDCQLE